MLPKSFVTAFDSLWLDGAVAWPVVERALPFVADLSTCGQDPVHHAEGDVWTHTKMVVEALKADRAFSSLPEARRQRLALAALLHDIAKPRTRAELFDLDLHRIRVTHAKHSALGAQMAWVWLWEQGVPAALRADVHALILWHQKAFHVFASPASSAQLVIYSQIGRWSELLAHAHADNRGRISPSTAETAETLELLAVQTDELGVADAPWPFETDEARLHWLDATATHSLSFTPYPKVGSEVVVLSGLPGMGKDTYARQAFPDLPVVSLDRLREELDISPSETQGKVIQAAFEEARVHLRAKRPFVWNATNLTRLARGKIIRLCRDYDARVAIHALDTPAPVTRRRNREREAQVPDAVIARMLDNWEPPTSLEAHRVHWIGGEV